VRDEDHDGDEPVVCDDGRQRQITPRLIIVPVDAHGVDLSGLMSVGGHKDMPEDGKYWSMARSALAIVNNLILIQMLEIYVSYFHKTTFCKYSSFLNPPANFLIWQEKHIRTGLS
jgi:hypothetical protein